MILQLSFWVIVWILLISSIFRCKKSSRNLSYQVPPEKRRINNADRRWIPIKLGFLQYSRCNDIKWRLTTILLIFKILKLKFSIEIVWMHVKTIHWKYERIFWVMYDVEIDVVQTIFLLVVGSTYARLGLVGKHLNDGHSQIASDAKRDDES